METELIWYNPDYDIYQKGSPEDFQLKINSSRNQDRFSILYQFNRNSRKIAEKVLHSLNLVREESRLD